MRLSDAWRPLLAVAFALASPGCAAELVRDLDGAQANEVVAELDRRGIFADKETTGSDDHFRITVGKSQLASAIAALAQSELPRPHRPGVQATFKDGSLVPTPLEERARLAGALAADLERTLELFPAVERARVHVAIDAGSDVFTPPSKPSASVLLRLRARGDVNGDELKRIVAASVAGLEPGRIDLVTTRGTAEPVGAAAAAAVAGGRERSLYVALAALALVFLLALALFFASRRLAAAEKAPTPVGKPRPQPG